MSLPRLDSSHAKLIATKILLIAVCVFSAMNVSVKRQVDSVRRQVEFDQKLFSDIGVE